MEAATLHCPDCGAPARADARECAYCHARLATVACPRCFGLAFVGMRHCPACGALLQREKEPDAVTELTCPRCSGALEPLRIGATPVLECARCDGLWLDNPTFRGLRDALDRQAAVLASGVAPRYRLGGGASVLPVRYLRCPVCDALMDRVNFAHRSGVLIDVCREHGTWFDEGELHRVVEFISEGGMSGPGWSHAFVHFTR